MDDAARYTFEKMWEGPCSYHTPNLRRPANHSTRQCIWNQRVAKDEGNGAPPPRFPPRPPAQLTGENAEVVRAPQRMKPPGTWAENVNQVVNGTNNNNADPSHQNEFREHHQSYMVFVNESIDKQRQFWHAAEVNVVMPAVPKYMFWSD